MMETLLNPPTIVIGFHGRAGAGKDQSAKLLRTHILNRGGQFKSDAFASDGRRLLVSILKPYGLTMKHLTDRKLKEKVFGPLGLTPRQLMKDFMSGWGRNMVKDSIWTDKVMHRVKEFQQGKEPLSTDGPNVLVITDVRLPNEAKAIKERGGYIIEVRNEYAEAQTTTADNQYGTEDALPRELIDLTVHNPYHPKGDHYDQLEALLDRVRDAFITIEQQEHLPDVR